MKTILIIGGTSGLGSALAKAHHALEKKVIVTGRRAARLERLAHDFPGIETYEWDISHLSSIPAHILALREKYPLIDSIFLISGVQVNFDLAKPGTTSDAALLNEMNVNLTAPMLIARHFVPHLISLAQDGTKVNLFLITSGLGYLPLPNIAGYCASKAGIHSLAVTLRQTMNLSGGAVKENVNIVEIVPPYIDTDLDANHRGAFGGYEPVPLDEYVEALMKELGEHERGHRMKEIVVGHPGGIDPAGMWRNTFGGILAGMGVEG